jgi:hypothetical protein
MRNILIVMALSAFALQQAAPTYQPLSVNTGL